MSFNPQPFTGQQGEAPVSKTMQYKKITKPLLERKRRARINACLDELKDIMTGALQVAHNHNSDGNHLPVIQITCYDKLIV